MSRIAQEEVASRWVRLGVMFNVAPAMETPDVERLLLDTVRAAGSNSRLLIMAGSWLALFGDCVAKRRLAVMVRDELEREFLPRMGLLLEWAQGQGHRNRARFREALGFCKAASVAGPLSDVSRRSEVLRRLARRRASRLSLKWGCWMEAFEIKLDALRSAEWIARQNRLLGNRAICGGDLVASLLAEAGAGSVVFESESELARRYGASRPAIRDAVLKMKLAGHARQRREGKRHSITVSAGAWVD